MKFIKTPVTGMQDFLPADMTLRRHVLGLIRDTYLSCGFHEIETPVVEHIENLTGKMGGENEKLIFKVLKRGAELERGLKTGELADSGLRYDLTLPLSRYYANNRNDLPSPFKALQIGNVFRADRPQKGRFRQFTQCDIDIIGDESNLAEIELISATTQALVRIFSEAGISGFTVHINDRRILKAMAIAAGFSEEQLPDVYVTLDKLDKIGEDGVKRDLLDQGFDENCAARIMELLAARESAKSVREFIANGLAETIEDGVAENLDHIMETARLLIDPSVNLTFDPTLVRGMGYYTGTIFEISIDRFRSSIAGGGRYDKMIGNFSGQDAPACGFSIGFERIVTILRDSGFMPEEAGEKKAYLVDKKAGDETMRRVLQQAAAERREGGTVAVEVLKKNAKFQVEMLEKNGYTKIQKVYADTVL